MKKKHLKLALFKSVMSLLLCVAMLAGSTFAWFTDKVSSTGNIIQAGNLDIDLQWAETYNGADTVWNDAAGENCKPVFDNQNWEPGYTEVRYIKVSNEGNLAFKWLMSVIPVGMVGKLAEVIDVHYDVVTDNPDFVAPTAQNKLGSLKNAGALTTVINNEETIIQGVLLPVGKELEGFYSGEVIACVSLHMQESAGNEYQGENVGDAFNILLQATQYSFEDDSFDNTYDKESTYPHVVTDLQLNADVTGLVDENNRLTKEIVLTDPPTGISAVLPVGTLLDADVTELILKITEDDVDANVTLDTRVGYDVEVVGVARGNDKPIVIHIPKALPAMQTGVQLFHAGKAMTRVYATEALSQREGNNDTYGDKYIYDFNSGNVWFSLLHFSNVSLASTDTVKVKGKEVTGTTINLNNPGEWLKDGKITVPADGNIYILTYNSGDQSKKNALDLTLTHTWHNLNPGEMSATPIKVEKGAKVVLNGVNIRTNSGVDALELVNPANVTNNKLEKTYIYVADATQNWLTGKSGIGFGSNGANYTAEIYVEGNGSLYTTAMGWGSPGIGVDSYSDGNQSKMYFSVGFLRSIPMNAAAGIGGGFAGQSWFSLKHVEINGGTYHLYRGGDSASIGTGTNGDIGEIIIHKGSTVNCYTNPWTAFGRNMGCGMYAGSCAGIFVEAGANVLGWSHNNRSYGDWKPNDNYVPGGRANDANVVINGFKTIDSIEATVSKGVYTVMAKFGDIEVKLAEGQYKVDESNNKVTSNAVYGYDSVSKEYVACVISSANVPTVETTAVAEVAKGEFLYRVGNQNNVTKAQIATMLTGKSHDGNGVDIESTENGNAEYNGSKFTGTGIVKVTIDGKEYYLEVVNAMNTTTGNIRNSGLLNGTNFVLLNDVEYTETQTITMDGSTIYGNGFEYDFSKFTPQESELGNVFVIHMKSATLDNVQLIGKVYTDGAYVYKSDTSGAAREYYMSLVFATGDSRILNSYVSGTRAPVRAEGNVTIENTTLAGGNVANIDVKSGVLNLKNVTTINQGTNPVGYGIFMDNDAGVDEDGNPQPITVNINGLTSYNWLKSTDSAYMNDKNSKKPMPKLLDSVFANSKFAGAEVINFRVVCLNENASVVVNGLGDPIVASISGSNGRLWADTGSLKPEPEYVPNGTGTVPPAFTWSEYSATIDLIKGGSVEYNADLLSAYKYGQNLNVNVSCNGGTMNGKNITFNTAGTYTITYTVTDEYNHRLTAGGALEQYTENYTFSIELKVNETEPQANHVNIKLGGSETQEVLIDGKKFLVPVNYNKNDASKWHNVNGHYWPVVSTIMSDGINGQHSSKYSAYFPIFGDVVEITDYANKGTGDPITYKKSTVTDKFFPSDQLKFVQCNDSKDGNPALAWQSKNQGTTNPFYATPGSANGDWYLSTPYFTQNKNAHTTYIMYSYTDNIGETYYYIVWYETNQQTYKSCVTSDTLVMLADGTQKRIDQVTYDDQLLVWNFFEGKYDVVPSAIIFYHGDDNYRILNLHFEDGTTVKVIHNHGFFSMEENAFVFITEENVEQYIGQHFAKVDGADRTAVKLVGYSITEEYTGCYSIQSAMHNNFMTEGMFSETIPEYEGWFDYFEIGDDMKYDEAKMKADIAKYGLYEYAVFAKYGVTYEQFIAFNGPYLKVLVGRGVLTFEDILDLISSYVVQ